MKIRAIVTGVTGMVGEGVLHECLNHTDVESVLVVGRKPCGVEHPKLKEVVHKDFFNLLPIYDQLEGYNACYFCLGVSSVGMKEPEYFKLTYVLTLTFARAVSEMNAGMTFCYVSGAGTDSTENGKSMWARIKGKTENTIMKLPFRQSYMFRPGYIHPTKGLKNVHKAYYWLMWLYPILRFVFPKTACTLREVGLAMIQVTKYGYEKQIINVKDIVALAAR